MPSCPVCGRESPEDFRHCGYCGAALSAPAVERRKLATLVFCDLAGSTALGERVDAEAVRASLARYFEEMRAALERHGGTVEKFIGDAVVAAFGVPETHDDDALRACRAALEMQARAVSLSEDSERRFGVPIAIRIGLNTGEVIAGDSASRHTFVTGDAVNVAARLEQFAQPGEVLVGEATVRLLRDALDVEPVEPLVAKGKSDPVPAYRLLAVRGTVPQRAGAPLAGRELELQALEDAYADVVARSACRIVSVLGEAGVGKSRLAAELALRVSAHVVRGTCLSYGEGITYRPIAQVVRELAGLADDDALARVGGLAAGLLAQLLGLADGAATPAETAWATRVFLAERAALRPLIVVIDDLHWAEPPLFDLIESLTTVGAPVLVLCLARSELLERRPGWHADVQLEPLAASDAADVVASLAGTLPADVRERLVHVSAGNPLFLEELVATLLEAGVLGPDGAAITLADLDALDLPASLQALLGARLDRLEPAARDALERGAIEGEVFHRGAVVELTPPAARDGVDAQLAELARRDLVRPAESTFAGDVAYRFKHILLRDAAYQATAKSVRAELHERFADWLERVAGARRAGRDAILGYHLEQSYDYRTQLGPIDDEVRALGDRAALRLAAAGDRAHAGGDARAAASLFARAAGLSSAAEESAVHALRQAGAMREALEFADAEALVRQVRDAAVAAGWAGVEAGAEVELATIGLHTRPGRLPARLREIGAHALAVFEGAGDDRGVALTLLLLARERWMALRLSEMEELLDRALPAAERSGDERLVAEVLRGLAQAAVFGPRRADETLARGQSLLTRARAVGPVAAESVAMLLGVAEASVGNRDRSRALADESVAVLGEIAPGWMVAGAKLYAGLASLTAGEPERAEAELLEAREVLAEHGELGVASTVIALRSRALLELGRLTEAESEAELALKWADPADVVSLAYAHGALARVLASRGVPEEALGNARRAVELSAASDFLNQRGDAHLDLALVLTAAGDTVEAGEAAREALAFYRAKGNVVAVARPLIDAGDGCIDHDRSPSKGEHMSEYEADRPAPEDPEEEASPPKDFLFGEEHEADRPAPEDPEEELSPTKDFLFGEKPDEGESDSGDESDA